MRHISSKFTSDGFCILIEVSDGSVGAYRKEFWQFSDFAHALRSLIREFYRSDARKYKRIVPNFRSSAVVF